MQQPRQMYQDGSIMPRLNDLSGNVSSAEQMLQEINQRLQSAESTLGEGGATQQPASLASDVFTSAGVTGGPQLNLGQNNLSSIINPIRPGVQGSTLSSTYSNNYIGDRGSEQSSPLSSVLGFGAVGDPRLGAPDVPNSLQQIMRGARADGGMMGRQQYGLGSLVKSVTKGVKSAVKGIADVAKSPLGLAAIASFVPFGGQTLLQRGMGFLGDKGFGLPEILSKGKDFFGGEKTFGKTAAMFAGGSLLGGLLNQAEAEGDPEGITRNVGALKLKLADAYRNQRTFADAEDEEAAIAQQVDLDTSEYTQDMARTGAMYGGRIGYALGSPEQNAIEAAGIMNLPLNKNPAGVTELDLRETGGFIPPVGVKEKADDIPAMLANNEFVFTADAVRGMGDGNVNKGAQRMYDMMKKLEKGGRV